MAFCPFSASTCGHITRNTDLPKSTHANITDVPTVDANNICIFLAILWRETRMVLWPQNNSGQVLHTGHLQVDLHVSVASPDHKQITLCVSNKYLRTF